MALSDIYSHKTVRQRFSEGVSVERDGWRIVLCVSLIADKYRSNGNETAADECAINGFFGLDIIVTVAAPGCGRNDEAGIGLAKQQQHKQDS